MLRLALVSAFVFAFGLTACADPRASQAQAQGAAFLAQNAKADGVITLPDGLQYKVVEQGGTGGASPLADDHVIVHYEGKLLDGTVFDSSYQRGQPATFVVNQLIPAWTEALQKMKPGDTWMLYVPPKLGYGGEGAGPIPPNSVLIFKMKLIGILPRDASVGNG